MQMAIDLPTIAQTYYGGGIDPHPVSLTSYYMGGGWGLSYEAWPQTLKDEYAYNTTAAKKLLADAGYPTGFKTNVVADASSDMDLLLIVKSYLAAVGIDMSIQSMDSTAFGAFVTNGHKQDQLAYKTSGVLAANQEPSRQLAYFMPGNVNNIINVNDPGFNAFYDKAMAASSVAQWHQILADANLYVAQQHFTISLLEPNVYCFVQPWLKGYNGQLGSISGGSGGTLFMGFYGARFWIDQKLKKSMGE
jgi:peptide/nickel transport system substrate-binding protein